MTLLEELVHLEQKLLRLGPGCDRACIESLLAEDFVEFGASGRVWTRTAIMDELELAGERFLSITDEVCRPLSENVALLTYRILGERASLRSSLWVRREGRWQMIFHQGTLVSSQPA